MQPRELTLRGLVLGALLTVLFTAANVYIGLKVGLTFASSIPAAVISMAVLSAFRNSSILENNIVQTVASAAGTLSAIIFVLPGLVIVGWWAGFPYWQSFFICLSGGILGVLFTIPLRRALVTNSDLPYPEGVAAAEVLKVGSEVRGEGKADPKNARTGLMAVTLGGLASAGLSFAGATQLVATEVSRTFRFGLNAASGLNLGWSLALLGAGHLVGLSVGLAMLTGLLIAWAIAIPIVTSSTPIPAGVELADHVTQIWRQVRFIGAGAIGISAVWTLVKLAKPVIGGLISSVASSRKAAGGDERDRDLEPKWIFILTAACLAIAGVLSYGFAHSTPELASKAIPLTAFAIPFVLIVSFLIAGVCGYMAGLIGASNSPLSGVGIVSIFICASILAATMAISADSRPAFVAFALFVTSIVFACATISNDNLQDLKTGQLVGASPRRQQIALFVGVAAGAAVIPFVLNLMNKAFGFAGAPNLSSVAAKPLGAPQANLISTLAKGIIGGDQDWKMVQIGIGVGVAIILIDVLLKRSRGWSLPPLAVGIGIYLPMSATFAVVVGAVLGHWFEKWTKRTPSPARAEQLGTLAASGLIVGESLFGVLYAGLIVATQKDAPISLLPKTVPADNITSQILGAIAFIGLTALIYRWTMKKAR